MKFNEVSLDKFWILEKREYPVISVRALDVLLQFSTSYLCEQAFSCLTIIKSKSRNRLLSVEEELSELPCDRTLKMKFNEVLLDKFWILAKREERERERERERENGCPI